MEAVSNFLTLLSAFLGSVFAAKVIFFLLIMAGLAGIVIALLKFYFMVQGITGNNLVSIGVVGLLIITTGVVWYMASGVVEEVDSTREHSLSSGDIGTSSSSSGPSPYFFKVDREGQLLKLSFDDPKYDVIVYVTKGAVLLKVNGRALGHEPITQGHHCKVTCNGQVEWELALADTSMGGVSDVRIELVPYTPPKQN